MTGSKPVHTPIQQNHNLAFASGYVLRDMMKYRRLVGGLVYLTITRPDLVYAVHVLSQFMNEPRKEHWDAALRVVKYVKMNPSVGIVLKRDSDMQLRGYCDSDWARCPLTRRSLSGYIVSLGNSPISWRAKKQVTVSKSTAETEYRAMAAVTSELIWVKSFLASLGVFHMKPMRLFCDNQAAIHIARIPVFHDRTKHIEIDCHFVRQHLVNKTIATFHVRSKEQIADLFTKALGGEAYEHLLYKLGLGLPSAPT
ncbi:secreted RxLR effector protein 161-like [Silene latifolia]|uniref:secreted RxLR effector protein 161-like n=1 Tax=Silene latifolia TaxID=37657 RepID=UPI003D76D7CB